MPVRRGLLFGSLHLLGSGFGPGSSDFFVLPRVFRCLLFARRRREEKHSDPNDENETDSS